MTSLRGAVVAFDLDGTLVETAPDLIGTLNLILAEHGHAGLPLMAARHLVGRGARVMLQRGFAEAGETLDPRRADRLFEQFIALYRGRIALESRPFPGVTAALNALAADGARLAVCTNKRTDLSVALLDALGLSGRFAAIVGPDTADYAKPDPRHLLAAIEAAGGETRHSVMVGNSDNDLDAARAAGIPVVLVSFGYTDTPAAQLGPDALIDHFSELPGAVRRLLTPPHAAMRPALPGTADA